MEKLKIRKTLPYVGIIAGFYLVLLCLTLFLEGAEAELVRIFLLEWCVFPMLAAITGGVMAQKEGFLPLFGLFAGLVYIPFMYLFFAERTWDVVFMYAVFGYVGSAFGAFLHYKEVKRIEEGRPPKPRRRSFIFKLFDRHNIDQYK